MRIGQVAELAGVTARAVRHYHRLGLLPEPRRRGNGYREYGVDDLFRLLRIRSLAASGVPLARVGALLAPPEAALGLTVDDLRELVRANDEQVAELTRRGDALRKLLAQAETGQSPTSLSPEYDDALGQAVAGAASDEVRDALRRDAATVGALGASPAVPPGLVEGLESMLVDVESRAEYLEILHEWTALEGRPVDRAAVEIDRLVDRLTAMFHSSPVGELIAAEGSAVDAGSGAAGDAFLVDAVPDPAQRAVIVAVQRRLSVRGEE